MRPVVVKAPSGTGTSTPVIIDQYIAPEHTGLAITVGTGSATSKVQFSLDDPFATYATDYNTNGTWFDHPILSGVTANAVGSLSIPCRAVRLNNTVWASGVLTLTVVQAGI